MKKKVVIIWELSFNITKRSHDIIKNKISSCTIPFEVINLFQDFFSGRAAPRNLRLGHHVKKLNFDGIFLYERIQCYHPGPRPLLALADLHDPCSSNIPTLLVAESKHMAPNPPCADVELSTHHPAKYHQMKHNLCCHCGEKCAALVLKRARLWLYSPCRCRFHQPEWERSVWKPLK